MLSRTERLILWNQYEILKRLDPAEEKLYRENQEILAHGFEVFYGEINQSIYDTSLSNSEANETMDILNVFRASKFSCSRLDYKPKSSWAEFQGFDGNAATGHYAFAKFLRRTQGKWSELSDRPDNSHSHVLDKYLSMVAAWKRFGENYELSAEQIEAIAAA